MPVARSYSGFRQVNEPFKKDGKMYVTVVTDKGLQKVVRWYSESEYARMYPEVKKDRSKDPYYKPQKIVLGFEKGYITIFKGVTEENEWWFRKTEACRYAKWWGWYVPSTIAVPVDYPEGVQEVKLTWEPMGNEEDWLKSDEVTKQHVRDTLLGATRKENPTSKPQGNIGHRLDIRVKVIGKQTEENKQYNTKTHFYEFKDEQGNFYKWKTSARDWSVGTEHHIRGTVKEYDEYDGEPATVLTRCIEQKN